MLTPEEIRDLVETLQPALDGLNTWITKDLIRRFMARMERHEQLRLTNTDAWQIEVYRSAGGHVEDLREQLAKFTHYTDTEIAAIFEDAGIRAYAADALVYASSGIEVAPLAQSNRMIAILEDTYKRTKGEVHNFTRTTARLCWQMEIPLLSLISLSPRTLLQWGRRRSWWRSGTILPRRI